MLGEWTCDLADDALTWTAGVYDIFGLPNGAAISRAEIVSLYREESRAAMEALRNHAIRHRRGFTLDAEIRTAGGEARWMRLIATPLIVEDRVMQLHGIKQDVSALYR